MPPRKTNRSARPNDHSDSDPDVLEIPADVQKIAASQPELPTIIKEARKLIKRKKPALTAQQLQEMLPRGDIDATWTAQDEQDLQQAWDNDPLKPYLLDERGNKHLQPLWRYTMRFMGMPVEEIIGPKFNLAYDNSSNEMIDINGREVHHPNWSAKFCEKLLHLASHPMWLEQPGAMTTCIQYVVKCRTNDQRQMRWPKENNTSDKFFDVFQSVNDTFQDGTKTVVELRKEVNRRLRVPSLYSRLFATVETLAFRAMAGPLRAPAAVHSNVGMYAVSTEDLTRLMKALDQQTDTHGLPLHRPTVFTAAAAKAAKKSYDLPRASDLANARERVLLGIRRDQAKAAKLAAQPGPQQQPVGEPQSGDQSDPGSLQQPGAQAQPGIEPQLGGQPQDDVPPESPNQGGQDVHSQLDQDITIDQEDDLMGNESPVDYGDDFMGNNSPIAPEDDHMGDESDRIGARARHNSTHTERRKGKVDLHFANNMQFDTR
ncbi:hypothetical protein F4818DRAFT_456443 [Hypoxylon cercidicola]|nr:hypothetical protein F4818DRAFT_456443 [Hypoxylon cercidicola]